MRRTRESILRKWDSHRSAVGWRGDLGKGQMMTRIFVLVTATVLVLAFAAPAFATGADGAGRSFGLHHATHAREMGGFTGEMNPGVMHRGFSGWSGGM